MKNLFSRILKNFWLGISYLIDIRPRTTTRKTDAEAIAGDWQKVGADLTSAMDKYDATPRTIK